MNSSWLIQVALAAQAASLSEAWVGVAVRASLGVRVPGSRDVTPFFPLPVRIDRGRSGQRESGMRLARIARVVWLVGQGVCGLDPCEDLK